MTPGSPLPQRFWNKVHKTDSCWLWTGLLNKGYGQFGFSESGVWVSRAAHRLAYLSLIGPIPDGLVLDHFVCDTPRCVNPSHLRPVSRRENNLRSNSASALMLARTHCGEGHEFTPANTLRTGRGGWRRCRECNRLRCRARRQLVGAS